MTTQTTQNGIVVRINWVATLKAIKVGESKTFRRCEISVSNLRIKCSRLKREGFVFTVKAVNNDEAAIVTRER